MRWLLFSRQQLRHVVKTFVVDRAHVLRMGDDGRAAVTQPLVEIPCPIVGEMDRRSAGRSAKPPRLLLYPPPSRPSPCRVHATQVQRSPYRCSSSRADSARSKKGHQRSAESRPGGGAHRGKSQGDECPGEAQEVRSGAQASKSPAGPVDRTQECRTGDCSGGPAVRRARQEGLGSRGDRLAEEVVEQPPRKVDQTGGVGGIACIQRPKQEPMVDWRARNEFTVGMVVSRMAQAPGWVVHRRMHRDYTRGSGSRQARAESGGTLPLVLEPRPPQIPLQAIRCPHLASTA